MFSGAEHEVKNVRPHGNSKFKSSYRRILLSTREKMKQSFQQKEKTVKEVLDQVYISAGDVTMARSLGELPRGPADIYNARRLANIRMTFQMCQKMKLVVERVPKVKTSMWTLFGHFWNVLKEKKNSRRTPFSYEIVRYSQTYSSCLQMTNS